MNWIKFIFWLLCIYGSYYAALICWDSLRLKRGKNYNDQEELTFVEDVEPVSQVSEENSSNGRDSPVVFSGGVSLKELFNLAREESVEYIKSVSY